MNIWNNRKFSPMLLKEIDKPFNSKDYIFELKYDGIRALCFVNNKTITFQSRNNNDLTYLFPELLSIKDNIKHNVIFDGEIVCFDKTLPSFTKVQERIHLKNKAKIKRLSESNPAVFIVFDIIFEDKNLTTLPLFKRKEILNYYKDTEYFIKTKYTENFGIKLFKKVKKLDLEGIVAKNKTGKYHINSRTDDFIKIKNMKRDEFLIGGFKENKVNISLFLCQKNKNTYKYVGKCSASKKKDIYKLLLKQKPTKNYITDFDESITYIKPTISCYIEYTEITKNGHVRHPIYKGVHNEI